jgi:Zn-dependent metalloprotease
VNIKKIGALSLSAALTFGGFSSQALANELNLQAQDKPMFMVASTESEVTKDMLIQKLKKLFPGKLDGLTSQDYHFDTGHRYIEDEEGIVRYHISFHKQRGEKELYGGAEFVGESLDLQSFYYSPVDIKDALFPAKVTEKEALQAAETFMKAYAPDRSYRVNSEERRSHFGLMNLTEPVRYHFTFERLHNDLPVIGQSVSVTVLGNGEIVEMYGGELPKKKMTYEENSGLLSDEAALEQVKKEFNVALQYVVDYNYRGDGAQVKLVYGVDKPIDVIHAKSGKWLIGGEFTNKLPEADKLKMVSSSPVKGTAKPITEKEAKAIAEKLLKPGNDDIKLKIEEVSEQENEMLGKTVYSVHYMYHSRNSGHGASIELDKNTGEIINFYDISEDVFGPVKKDSKKAQVTYEQALEKAAAFMKQHSPSIVHEYSYPVNREETQPREGGFHFSFPRVKNGLAVIGDSVSVFVKKDGSISQYGVHSPKVTEWPSTEKVVSKEKALQDYLDDLKVNLMYMNPDPEKSAYSLVYHRDLDHEFHYYNAVTGEWETHSDYPGQGGTGVNVSHPTAEKELNHLIQMGIIKVEDPDSFNADVPLTKGEALEVLMKSIANYYELEHAEYREKPTFMNITKENPLYSIVELAAQQNIIDTTKSTFPADEKVTNEELAYWYIRALDLDLAARHSDIYTLPFKDAAEVGASYKGYVALAAKLGLFEVKDNTFSPKHEVTLADIALSNIRLAQKIGQTR